MPPGPSFGISRISMKYLHSAVLYVQMPKNIPKEIPFRHPVTILIFPVEAVSRFCDELPPLLK